MSTMLQLQRYSGCYVVQKLFKGCSKVVQRLLILNNIEREALNAEGFERAQRFELMKRINGGEYENKRQGLIGSAYCLIKRTNM